MKRFVAVLALLTAILFSFGGCGSTEQQDFTPESNFESSELEGTDIQEQEPEDKTSAQDEMRQQVIDKWANEADSQGTGKFIEDAYKAFPDDYTIRNIYFYTTSKECLAYGDEWTQRAKEYAVRIDADYDGEFAEEIHQYVNDLIPSAERESLREKVSKADEVYNSLTNDEKKRICNYIWEEYKKADEAAGYYTGDEESDAIMARAAIKYGLLLSQIDEIWTFAYSW